MDKEKLNSSESLKGVHKVCEGVPLSFYPGISPYNGAARMIEIAPPGIPFRALANVDHITEIALQQKVEEELVTDEKGNMETNDEGNPTHRKQLVSKGFNVNVTVGGEKNGFTFPHPQIAINFYYQLHTMITRLGVPNVLMSDRLQIPVPAHEEEIPMDEENIPEENTEATDPVAH